MSDIITAAMIVIGDEILSGRTKDRNIGHLADIMTAIGVDLKEVRIVPDEEDEIVAAVNALRHRYDYVFTTGGIGPTHDDITADSVAKAFGVPCDYDAKAMALLAANYATRNIEFNDARKRMARMPVGATHIDNPVSTAPGFRIGNVHVMAGVPSIFQAMLDNVVPTLKTGAKLLVRHHPLPAWRRRHRRAARRNPEGASRHDHRLLPEISRRLVLDRTCRARPLPRSARRRQAGGRGDGRRPPQGKIAFLRQRSLSSSGTGSDRQALIPMAPESAGLGTARPGCDLAAPCAALRNQYIPTVIVAPRLSLGGSHAVQDHSRHHPECRRRRTRKRLRRRACRPLRSPSDRPACRSAAYSLHLDHRLSRTPSSSRRRPR